MVSMSIKSTQLLGLQPDPELDQRLRDAFKLPAGSELNFCVYETLVGSDTYFTCWAGGEIDPVQGPMLSLVGEAAASALVRLPQQPGKDKPSLYFQELKLGKIPLQTKVIQMLQAKPPGSYVCFVGDLAGELDGHMAMAFNLCGARQV